MAKKMDKLFSGPKAKINTMNLLYTTIFILFFFILPFQITATGISVYPEKLKLSIDSTTQENSPISIKISNPGSEVSAFEAYLEEFPNTLKISPKLSVLGPGGQTSLEIWPIYKELEIAGNPKRLTLNIVSTEIKNDPILLSAGYKMNIELQYKRNPNKGFNSDKFLAGLLALSLLLLPALIKKNQV